MPIGTFRKKIDSQPIHSTRAPPTSGPKATATPMVAPYTPIATPRSRPGLNSWATSASETANMIAPPTPWSARDEVEERRIGREAGEGRRDGEYAESRREHAPAAEPVGEHARGEHQGRERQRVRVDDPLEVGEARVEVL